MADIYGELFLHCSSTKSSFSALGPAFGKLAVETNRFNLVKGVSGGESSKNQLIFKF